MIKKIVLQSIIYSTVFLFIFLFSFAFAQSSSNDNTLNCGSNQFLTIGSDGLKCASIGPYDIQIGVSLSSLSAVCDNGIRELQVVDEDDEGLIKGIIPTCVVIPVCGVNEVLSYIETETDTDTYAFQCINLDTFSGTFCPPNQTLTNFRNGRPICQTFILSRGPLPVTPISPPISPPVVIIPIDPSFDSTTPDVCPPDPITNDKRIPIGYDVEGNPICEELPEEYCPTPGEVFSDTYNMCVPDCSDGDQGKEWNISENSCTCPEGEVIKRQCVITQTYIQGRNGRPEISHNEGRHICRPRGRMCIKRPSASPSTGDPCSQEFRDGGGGSCHNNDYGSNGGTNHAGLN